MMVERPITRRFRLLLAGALLLVAAPALGNEAAADSAGPPAPELTTADSTPAPVVLDEELALNIDMQSWGHGLLGTGIVLVITGTVMIEADSQGGVGKAGFAGIGAGIGVMTVGMFLLGFSQPVHLREPTARLSPTPVAWGQGAVLTYDRYF